MKHLYKYPQQKFPYSDLIDTNKNRSKKELEYELLNTKLFDENNYFDIYTEYAKNEEDDLLIVITINNRAKKEAPIWVLPTLWCRNLWDFGLLNAKPTLEQKEDCIEINHPELGLYYFYFDPAERVLFTENESKTINSEKNSNSSPYVKDLFHKIVLEN